MCSRDGVSLAPNGSSVMPSTTAAATDRARMSSFTLVRSVDTPGPPPLSDSREGDPCPVTHEQVWEGPRPATTQMFRASAPYRGLADRAGEPQRPAGPHPRSQPLARTDNDRQLWLARAVVVAGHDVRRCVGERGDHPVAHS